MTSSERLSGSGEMPVCKGQGQKSVLDACDLSSLRQECIKNRHDSLMEIPQEYFQKSLFVNTVHPQVHVKALPCKEEARCDHSNFKRSYYFS